jgi:DNA-binding winged helix-turn-helix (wHTH) protein
MRVRFGSFTFDSDARQLLRHGQDVHLSAKAFDVLQVLLAQRPKVVSKAELRDRIWPGTFVVDANLNVLVAEIRRALDDSPKTPGFVRTVHRVGYAFCGAVDDLTDPRPSVTEGGYHRWWLAWNEKVLPIVDGENVLGRDPRSAVWLDASGVSRRHACIRVNGDQVTIEDLGSRNGTFVGQARVGAPQRLEDGDVIGIGSIAVTFRIWSDDRAPQTEPVTASYRWRPQG